MNTSLPKLVAIAGCGGMAVGVMALLLKRKEFSTMPQKPFVHTALNIMKKEKSVMDLLGSSYEIGNLSNRDGWSKMEPLSVRLKLPLKGTNDSAEMFIYARKKEHNERLKLYKLEMKFHKIPGKKLVILDVGDKEEIPNDEIKSPEKFNKVADVQRKLMSPSKANS